MEYNGNGEFTLGLEDFDTFNLTPERIRELALARKVSSGPGLDSEYMPTTNELDTISDMLYSAVSKGQLIDFGYWPNDMIKATSKRGGKLYVESALAHPFSSPYVIMHSWDDAANPIPKQWLASKQNNGPYVSAYLVNPYLSDDVCCDFEAMELEGIVVQGDRCLGVGDRINLDANESKACDGYAVNVVPFILRFPSMLNDPNIKAALNRFSDPLRAAAANVLDPIMTALSILATKGVRSETVNASPKLAKARTKHGKPAIPPYRKVDSRAYVTAILSRQEHVSRSQGGTHASPITHMRIGHWRHYKSGEKSFIHDTLVNATEEMRKAFVSHRTHYVVKDN